MFKFKQNLMFQNAINCDAKTLTGSKHSCHQYCYSVAGEGSLIFCNFSNYHRSLQLPNANSFIHQTRANTGRRVPLLLRVTVPKAPWSSCSLATVLTTWPACSPAQLRKNRSGAVWGSPCHVSEWTRLCPASTTGHVCSCYTSKSVTCKTDNAWGRMLKPCMFNWAAPLCLPTLINAPLSVILFKQKVRTLLCCFVCKWIHQHWAAPSDYHSTALPSIKNPYPTFKLIASA